MTYRGTVKNGVVVLEPDAALPDGTEVKVEPASGPTIFEKLGRLAGRAKGLPTDMARNHDHYLHALPKK
jgi:hypothetical protein